MAEILQYNPPFSQINPNFSRIDFSSFNPCSLEIPNQTLLTEKNSDSEYISRLQEIQGKYDINFNDPLSISENQWLHFMVESLSISSENIPNQFYHMIQVPLVTQAILKSYAPDDIAEGNVFAYGHDIGRIYNNYPIHAIKSQTFMNGLGLPQKYGQFGYDHHRGGFGPEPDNPALKLPGKNSTTLSPTEVIDSEFQTLSERESLIVINTALAGAFPKNRQGRILEEITEANSQRIITEYGQPGEAALIADLSKKYCPQNRHISHIDRFSLKGAQELYKRQTEIYIESKGKNGYPPGGRQHRLDTVAALTFLYIKNRIGENNYHNAILRAQEAYPKRLQNAIDIWNSLPHVKKVR